VSFFAGAPCLSFDIIPDKLGESREQFPLTCYIVSGTQSQRGMPNYLNVMKLENITKTQKEKDDSEDESDEEDEEDEEDPPELTMVTMGHTGSINRLRVSVSPPSETIVTTNHKVRFILPGPLLTSID
jgi:ribosome assembly protein RRB1